MPTFAGLTHRQAGDNTKVPKPGPYGPINFCSCAICIAYVGAALAAASKCNTPNVKVQPPSRAVPPPAGAMRKRQPVTHKKPKDQQDQVVDKPVVAQPAAPAAGANRAATPTPSKGSTSAGQVCLYPRQHVVIDTV